MRDYVAIVGGGVAGLAAAHHLAMAGVRGITVYEKEAEVGGKAISQYKQIGQGKEYPGEHGFRFFPHFYRHLLETMRQIDMPSGGKAWQRLVEPGQAAVAMRGGPLLVIDRPAVGAGSFVRQIKEFLEHRTVSPVDAVRYAAVLLKFATSCDARREHEIDRMSWTRYTGADLWPYSQNFQSIVIRSSQALSAMRADRSSANTIGTLSLQFMFTPPGAEKTDALLCGPTSETWLRDWRTFLEDRGVRFIHATVRAFAFDEPTAAITNIVLADGTDAEARFYICAVPLESAVGLMTAEMKRHDPSLRRLDDLKLIALGDMAGIQFFLNRRVPIVRGHVQYPESKFALTSISQGQFWDPEPQARPGTPELKDVLSVIISDWTTPGTEGIAAKDYRSPDELAAEVWRQLVNDLPPDSLRDADLIGYHLDSNVKLNSHHNLTPLLIHPVDQLRLRPDAETAIANLFLASDYVRTFTDLATMEGADEAARRAVRPILQQSDVDSAQWPAVRPYEESRLFDFGKWQDSFWYGRRRPHITEGVQVEFESSLAADMSLWSTTGSSVDTVVEQRRELPPFDEATRSIDDLEAWERFLTQRPA